MIILSDGKEKNERTKSREAVVAWTLFWNWVLPRIVNQSTNGQMLFGRRNICDEYIIAFVSQVAINGKSPSKGANYECISKATYFFYLANEMGMDET